MFWVKKPFYSRHPVIAVAAVLTVLVVFASLVSAGQSGPVSAPAASDPSVSNGAASSSPSATAAPYGAKIGKVDPASNGLDSEQLTDASDLGSWLVQWEELDFDHADADDLRDLAADYKATGLGSTRVRGLLRDAAKLIDRGEAAAEKRHYATASKDYEKAASRLKIAAPLIRKDIKKAEVATGSRLSPSVDESYQGYDYLFPVETSADRTTVTAWVDGDTVETSAGRVRLVGVDTPEMKDPCSRAQSAKQLAESLAPPGSVITLTDPASVEDKDRYGRLLRYVDVEETGGSDATVVDVGYSLVKSSLAVARYDSRDGYEWHPRETLYRSSNDETVESDTCLRNAEKAAFVLAATLAKDSDSPEYWRQRILGRALLAPYENAKKYLPKSVASTRKAHEKQDRLEREAQERERAQQQREREREAEQNTSNSNEDDNPSGGSYPGYTGPRCYAPGGKTWKPC